MLQYHAPVSILLALSHLVPCFEAQECTPGSVKVDAEIQTTDGNFAKYNNIAELVVQAASSIPGVKAAAAGKLQVDVEVKTVSPTPAPAPAAEKEEEEESANVGAIVGGTTGGVVGLCCCCFAIYAFKKKSAQE